MPYDQPKAGQPPGKHPTVVGLTLTRRSAKLLSLRLAPDRADQRAWRADQRKCRIGSHFAAPSWHPTPAQSQSIGLVHHSVCRDQNVTTNVVRGNPRRACHLVSHRYGERRPAPPPTAISSQNPLPASQMVVTACCKRPGRVGHWVGPTAGGLAPRWSMALDTPQDRSVIGLSELVG